MPLGALDEVVAAAEALAVAGERITCTAGSRLARSTHAASSRGKSSVMPLPRAGRLSVMRATRSVTS